MKPICVPCQRFFKPEKSGLYFLEGMPTEHARPGKADSDKWKPYKLWSGDLWKCQDCGATVIVGTGRDQIAEHYESDFEEQVRVLGADQFQVNDC